MMRGQDNRTSTAVAALRRRAEAMVPPSRDSEETASPEELREMLHELKVYQIELELQNEELRTAQLSIEEARDKAEEARDQFMRLFHEAPVGYAVVDRSGLLLELNQTLRQMLGIPAEDALDYRAFAELLLPSDESIFRARFPAFFDQPSQKRMELRLLGPGKGESTWVEITGRPVSLPRRRPRGTNPSSQLLIIVSDISERKRLEGELMLAAKVFEHSAEGICITAPDGTILRINNAFTVVTGYQQEEVLGKNPRLLKSGRHDQEFYKTMWSALKQRGHWEGEIWNRRKNGEIYAEWLSISAIRDAAGHVMHHIAIFSDISERKVAEQQLEHLAHYDMLTSLPNRLLFHDRLKQALIKTRRYGTWLAVMLLDLDRFKEVNDQLGHDSGDLLLQQVAQRLTEAIRASDTLARLGGDEFIALLPSFEDCRAAMAGASTVAAHIVGELARPFDLNGNTVGITTSIGIAIAPQDGDTLSELIKHADTAMYNAKGRGRNNFQFYSAAMHRQSRDRTRMEQGLQAALSRNELLLYYQPKLALASGRIVGLEALLRWRRDDVVLEPDRFLRVAEESGVIVDIGGWVFDQACSLASRLASAPGGALPVAVNCSSRQLLAPQRLLSQLEEAMARRATRPEWLEIEITESAILQENSAAAKALARLREMGLRVTLDDFGTGHSSLSCLRRCPVDGLKIDRGFIADIGRNQDDEAIVRSILVLAATLKLSCVAEGIENSNQCEFLRDNGCDFGQGFHYWPPLTEAELETVLDSRDGMADDQKRQCTRLPRS